MLYGFSTTGKKRAAKKNNSEFKLKASRADPMAFALKEPPRLPVTVIAGGSWMAHQAGKTFAEIKEVPEEIAAISIQAFERVGHDLLWTGSNFVNYPFHFCGNTSKILQDVAEIGPNCFSLEKKVDLRQAKEVLGGKVCVAGNVSPTDAFLNGRPEEVLAEAKDCVRAWGPGGGFILTLGCDFPKTVPLENVLALMSMKQQIPGGGLA